MAESSPPPHAGDDIPEAVVDQRRSAGLSLVWLIPLVAALIGGWLAWRTLSEQGPTITITLDDATGLEAGKTRIVYRSVQMGTVSDIRLSEDRSRVVVVAEMQKQAEPMLRTDTRFWVVRARVAAGEVSGLSTLLSGAYIGMDPGDAGDTADSFVALDTPPVITGDLGGRQYTLDARVLGSLDIGSPVYYRQIRVGQVVGYSLDEDGGGVSVQLFVNAPYDRFVRENTRFWNASGAEFAVDTSGVRVRTESLITLISGGVAFGVPPHERPGATAAANHGFRLHGDRERAFERSFREAQLFVADFEQSVRGLEVGAPVEFRGIRLGEVTDVELLFDPEARALRIPVTLSVEPERVALASPLGDDARELDPQRRRLWDHLVAQGLRAQLKPASLLTGKLYVDLDFHPRDDARSIAWDGEVPELPTVPSTVEAVATTLQDLADQVRKVPLAEIAEDLRGALADFRRVMENAQSVTASLDQRMAPLLEETLAEGRDAMRRADDVMGRLEENVAPLLEQTRSAVVRGESAMAQAERTLQSADRLLAEDSPLQRDLKTMLDELAKAARSLRLMTDYLERHPDALLRGKGGN